MPGATILSPHPDDAVLSLWHVLTAPGEVTVLNVFGATPEDGAGDRWWDRLTRATDSRQRVAERAAEDGEALALAGRDAIPLGFADGQYRSEAPTLEALVEQIVARAPADATLYAPAALDGHRDHRLARDAAMQLRERGHAVTLYADVPHATVYGWPHWVTGSEPDPHLDPEANWDMQMNASGVALRELEPQVHRLDPAARIRKLEAVRTYRTQFAALEALWHVTRPEILGHEVVWPLA